MTRRRFSERLGYGALLAWAAWVPSRSQNPGNRYDDLFAAICKAIDTQFFDPGFLGIDWTAVKIEYRARVSLTKNDAEFLALTREMLRRLPTSHLAIRPPDTGVKVGIAVVTSRIEDRDVVIWVDTASDAQRAGLQPGDVLLGAREDIVGEPGTFADLKVQGCSGRVRSLRIRREPAGWPPDRPWVRWRKVIWTLQRSIGYMEIVRFDDGTPEEVDRAMSELKETAGLIIDVRRNEGGNLSFLRLTSYLTGGPRFVVALLTRDFLNGLGRAPELLSEATLARLPRERGVYTSQGILAALKRNGGGAAFYTEDVGDRLYAGQVVVLTSSRTASAAEGFVWSLKGTPRVTLVGRPTAGAVVGSEPVPLPGGWKIVLPTHAAWGPDRRIFRDTRIMPDIPIALTSADLCSDVDADMQRALEILQSRLSEQPHR